MHIIGSENISNKPWLDYSSLTLLQRCPRSYYWRKKRNLTGGGTAALINGKAYHEARATYRQSIHDGLDHESAKKKALVAATPIMLEIKEDDPKRNLTVALEVLNSYFDYWKGDSYETIWTEVGFAFDLVNFVVVGKIDEYAISPWGKVVM